MTSASDIVFYVCQLLVNTPKEMFQVLLEENDLEKRMKLVYEHLKTELELKKTKLKQDDKVMKRFGGTNINPNKIGASGQQSQEDMDEIATLQKKLDDLKLPEETKKITD